MFDLFERKFYSIELWKFKLNQIMSEIEAKIIGGTSNGFLWSKYWFLGNFGTIYSKS